MHVKDKLKFHESDYARRELTAAAEAAGAFDPRQFLMLAGEADFVYSDRGFEARWPHGEETFPAEETVRRIAEANPNLLREHIAGTLAERRPTAQDVYRQQRRERMAND